MWRCAALGGSFVFLYVSTYYILQLISKCAGKKELLPNEITNKDTDGVNSHQHTVEGNINSNLKWHRNTLSGLPVLNLKTTLDLM